MSADKAVSTTEMQRNFSGVLHEVLKGNSVVLKKHARPLAAVVPYAQYEAFRAQQQQDKLHLLHDRVREMAAAYSPRGELDEDDVLEQLNAERHDSGRD